tara:strand:- start:194 stop:397 length:204 start_codon:yes stop_codon:yes gene_type:complete
MKYILRSFENDNYYYYQDTKQELQKILKDWEERGCNTVDDDIFSFDNYKMMTTWLLKELNRTNRVPF